ncbi:MAG: transporter substrate-binding domain-containing protein [Clostridia bacterium]
MRARAGLAIFFIVFASSLLACGLLACSHTEAPETPLILDPAEVEWLQEYRGKLLFAPDPFYAPFEYHDEQLGGTTGLMHDYLKLVEEKLGIRLVRVRMDSFEQILSLARARHLAIVNAVTKTPERSGFLDFTEPLVEIDNVILVRKDQAPIAGLAELAGHRVAMVQDYTITEYVQSTQPDILVETVTTDLQALLAVSYSLADAAIIDLATASWLTQKQGLSNLKVSGNAQYPIRLAIASRNDWPVLTSILAKATAAITPEERQAILDKWLILEDTQNDKLERFYLILAASAGAFLVVGGFMFLWNRQLTQQIAFRTASLDQALAEKETLVLELHHRTNNALNVIIAMLQMELSTTLDPSSRQAMQDILNRTMTMGLVYQKLDGASRFTRLDLATYLPELAALLLDSHDGSASHIQLQHALVPASVPYDIAIPCGFIISELVSLSLSGTRTGDARAAIAITLQRTDDHALSLVYTDAGLDQAVAGARTDLLTMTAEHQLQGSIQFNEEPGTGLTCTLHFLDNVYEGRI